MLFQCDAVAGNPGPLVAGVVTFILLLIGVLVYFGPHSILGAIGGWWTTFNAGVWVVEATGDSDQQPEALSICGDEPSGPVTRASDPVAGAEAATCTCPVTAPDSSVTVTSSESSLLPGDIPTDSAIRGAVNSNIGDSGM